MRQSVTACIYKLLQLESMCLDILSATEVQNMGHRRCSLAPLMDPYLTRQNLDDRDLQRVALAALHRLADSWILTLSGPFSLVRAECDHRSFFSLAGHSRWVSSWPRMYRPGRHRWFVDTNYLV